MSLTICCVWVKGNVPFTAEYVVKLHSLCKQHVKREFEFICITDMPNLIPSGIRYINTKSLPKGIFGWWAKIKIFNPEYPFRKRVLYLDLDTLPVSSLDPIIDFNAPFALIPTAGDFKGRFGLDVVKKYNSSVMVFDKGCWAANTIFEKWEKSVTDRLWGDQDFIGEVLPSEDTFPLEWFPRLSEIVESSIIPKEAKVVLCKKPKNVIAAKQYPWFDKMWR